MKHKIICLLMAMALCLTQLPIAAISAEAETGAPSGYTVHVLGGVSAIPSVLFGDAEEPTVISLLSTNQDYSLPDSVSITMGDAVLTPDQYLYDKAAGIVTIIPQIIDDLTIVGSYPVMLSGTGSGTTVYETIGYADANTAFTYTINAPNGRVLPSSVTVKVGGKTLEMDENKTFSYDIFSGEITFVPGIITGAVSIKAHYPPGILMVENTPVYRYGITESSLPKGVSFDPSTQTLTLNNANLTSSYTTSRGQECGIYTNLDHLTIVLEGINTITMPATENESSYGIYAEGDLSIVSTDADTPGKLRITSADVKGTSSYAETCGIYASMASNHIAFENVLLEISAGTAVNTVGSARSYGIYVDYCFDSYDGMYIQDSTVTVSGGNTTAASNACSAGIYSNENTDDHITITNSTIYANGGLSTATESAMSYGITCSGDIHVLDNSNIQTHANTAESTLDAALNSGVFTSSTLSVMDSTLFASAQAVKYPEDQDGFSTGTFVQNLHLKNADFKSQGSDHALFLYGGIDLSANAGSWYRWHSAPDTAYLLSAEKSFTHDRDKTYLHILPINKTEPSDSVDDRPNPTTPTQFPDVHAVQHWSTEAVDFMIARDLLTGYADGTFRPNTIATRSQIITILWRMEGQPKADNLLEFTDISQGSWYAEAVRWAVSEGIVAGYSDTVFGANDAITREQLATILYRYEQYKGGGFKGMWMFLLDCPDRAEISDWAYEPMCWMYMNSIISGRGDGYLAPKDFATRAETAQIFKNYISNHD